MKRKSSSLSSGRLRRNSKRRRFGKSSKGTGRFRKNKYKGLRRKGKAKSSSKNSKYALRIAKRVFPQVVSKWMTLSNNNFTKLEAIDPVLSINQKYHHTSHMANHPHQEVYHNTHTLLLGNHYPFNMRAINPLGVNVLAPTRGNYTGTGDIHDPDAALNQPFALPRGFNRMMKMYEAGMCDRGTCRWKIKLTSNETAANLTLVAGPLVGSYIVAGASPIVHVCCGMFTPEEFFQFFPQNGTAWTKEMEDKLKLSAYEVLEVTVPYGQVKVLDLTRKFNVTKIYGKHAISSTISSALKNDPLSSLPNGGTTGGYCYPIDEFGFRSVNGAELTGVDHTSLYPATYFRPVIACCVVWRKMASNFQNTMECHVEYTNTSKYTFMNRRCMDPIQSDLQAIEAVTNFPTHSFANYQLANMVADNAVVGAINGLNGSGNI
jgi:hypothetical protein